MGLTHKQRAFVAAYAGNATEAAKKAGYSQKTAAAIGPENLKKPKILKAIQERENKEQEPDIATRKERQSFWTRTMRDERLPMKDRLEASRLLGKSEGDFLDRVEHSGEMDVQLNARAEIRTFLLEREKARADAGRAG